MVLALGNAYWRQQNLANRRGDFSSVLVFSLAAGELNLVPLNANKDALCAFKERLLAMRAKTNNPHEDAAWEIVFTYLDKVISSY